MAGPTSDSDPTTMPPVGFMGNSFRVVPDSPASMTVTVKAGMGFQNFASGNFAAGGGSVAAIQSSVNGVIGLDDIEQYKPMLLSSDFNFIAPAAPGAGNSRIDIIEVSALRFVNNPLSRDVLDINTGVFSPNTVNKTLEWDMLNHTGSVTTPTASTQPLSYKIGAVIATTTYSAVNVPPTTPGYIKIAEIFVGPTVATLPENKIGDFRRVIAPYASATVASRVIVQTAVPNTRAENIQAPAGFRLTAAVAVLSGLQTNLYVLIPSAGLHVLPSVQLMNDPSSSGTDCRIISLSSSVTTVDTIIQAILAGGNPPIQAAIGQPVAVFQWFTTKVITPFALTAATTPDPAIYSFSAKISSF